MIFCRRVSIYAISHAGKRPGALMERSFARFVPRPRWWGGIVFLIPTCWSRLKLSRCFLNLLGRITYASSFSPSYSVDHRCAFSGRVLLGTGACGHALPVELFCALATGPPAFFDSHTPLSPTPHPSAFSMVDAQNGCPGVLLRACWHHWLQCARRIRFACDPFWYGRAVDCDGANLDYAHRRACVAREDLLVCAGGFAAGIGWDCAAAGPANFWLSLEWCDFGGSCAGAVGCTDVVGLHRCGTFVEQRAWRVFQHGPDRRYWHVAPARLLG